MPGNGPDRAAPDNAAPLPTLEPISSSLSSLSTSSTPSSSKDTAGGAASAATGPAPVVGRKRRSTNAPSRGVANLTPEQLAKKRANDREAQRAIRKRTKAQIEALERKVQELSSQRPYLDLQAALKEKQAIQAENEEIKRKLAAVLEIIQPLVSKQGLSGEQGPHQNCRIWNFSLGRLTDFCIFISFSQPIRLCISDFSIRCCDSYFSLLRVN